MTALLQAVTRSEELTVVYGLILQNITITLIRGARNLALRA